MSMSRGQNGFEGLNCRLACGRDLSATYLGLVMLSASSPKIPSSVTKQIEKLICPEIMGQYHQALPPLQTIL